MKINDFIKEYDEINNELLRVGKINECIKNEYVPFEKKADAAVAIADACFWEEEKDSFGNRRTVLNKNSVMKYYLTYMAILELFTNLEKSDNGEQMLDDFNQLNKRGILKLIMHEINQDELSEFYKILEMVCDDVVVNEYENHAFVSKQITRLENLFSYVIQPIINELDFDKIKKELIALNKRE